MYGNLIFIKKTGGDGSKFPVTERDIKIGRSNHCVIRIHNLRVAPEHCQLIMEDNGQTTLRNLSNRTILNGKALGQGDITLCHGDIFELGDRLVRWEYLPTSQYYRQLLSPTVRLVPVVKPQKRSLGYQAGPGTSTSQASVMINTSRKRTYSARSISESSTPVKKRKSSGICFIHKARRDFPKFLTSHNSLKTKKLLLPGTQVKERKSTSGVVGSKTKGKLVGRSRKSTLPSWKVNIVSPSTHKSPGSRSPATSKKSTVWPKNAVKTPVEDEIVELQSSKKLLSSVSKSELKTQRKKVADSKRSEVLVKSNSQSVPETPLKSITGSPSNGSEKPIRSRWSFSKYPSPKKSSRKSPSKLVLSTPKQKPTKLVRSVQSEGKLNSRSGRRLVFPKDNKGMSLILENPVSTHTQSLRKRLHENVVQENAEVYGVLQTSVETNVLNEASTVKENQTEHKSVKKTPAVKICRKSPKNGSVQRTSKRLAESKVKTPMKRLPRKISNPLQLSTPREAFPNITTQTPLLIDLNYTQTSKKAKHTPRKSAKGSPLKKTPENLMKSVRKSSVSASRRNSIRQNVAVSPASPASADISTVKSIQTSAVKDTTLRKAGSLLKTGTNSPKGVRRKLSPSSSADRAAKMLKTSSPKKPDKNKKAALLVLGKANRKQLLSQNVKVLLKQKIIKKAIKQSTAGILQKGENSIKVASKMRRGVRKTAVTLEKKYRIGKKKEKSIERSPPIKTSKVSDAPVAKSPAKRKAEEVNETILEANEQSPSEVQTSLRLSSKSKAIEASEKSLSKQQNKKSESPSSIFSFKSSVLDLTGSLSGSLDKATEAYLLSSNRRCSKRLSSKNDTGRPDFIELSPTALGLIPKNVNIFKTPKVSKRRSSSLVTPKNIRNTGIMKSASTSKIGSRKSVRFSSKDLSCNAELQTPNTVEKAEFDFSFYQTPNVTVDMFVSPLTEKSTATKIESSESNVAFSTDGVSKISSTKIRRSTSEPQTCVRKLLQTPRTKKSLEQVSLGQISPLRSSRTSSAKLLPRQSERQSKATDENESMKSDVGDECRQCLVRQSSVKPKPQKSPKNNLIDVRGVKKLFQTPKIRRSPKNDLTDVRGVKKLFQIPKVGKSPKNDLTDVRGVKKLLQTPTIRKSPRNDLTDVRGVKKLMRTPKAHKSPKNDLTDVEGVKQLLGSPRAQKSPYNDLSDLRGVKRLLASPKVQKSPKNDLVDVTGVKKLLATPRMQKSPKNNLLDVSGIGRLFSSPVVQEIPEIPTAVLKVLMNSPQSGESFNKEVDVARVKQVLISKTSENVSKTMNTVSRKFHVNDYRTIRGRRTIYSTPKTPKNDLSDVRGVRELFSRHKPTSDYNISYTGVAELFDLPNAEVELKPRKERSSKESVLLASRKSKRVTSKKEQESGDEKDGKTRVTTRRGRLRKAAEEETKKGTRGEKAKSKRDAEGKKPVKRKGVDKIKTTRVKKSSDVAKKPEKVMKKGTKTRENKSQAKTESSEGCRKRRVLFDSSESPPLKLQRKLPAREKSVSKAVRGGSGGTVSKTKMEPVSKNKVTVKRVRKVAVKTKDNEASERTKEIQPQTGTKQIKKVQSRSQRSSKTNSSDSKGNLSPRKTRSGTVRR